MRRQVQLRRRTPLRATTPLRRAPLRSHRKASVIPDTVRQVVAARSNGQCEFRWTINPENVPARCWAHAVHMHHRLPRSAGGEHTAANLLHVCADHHDHIHAHPTEAYEHGWLLRRGTPDA